MDRSRDARETRAALDGLRAGRPWGELVALDEVGSTNAYATTLTRPWSVVVAERQTRGRGRQGRGWEQRPGLGLAMTLRAPALPDLGWAPLAAGLALHDVLTGLGLRVGLKWPNDLLWVDGEDEVERKVSGILCEAVPARDEGGPAVLVGIGLNVGHDEDELPVPGAGSVALAARAARVPTPTRDELLRAVLDALRDRLDPLRPDALVADYRRVCRTLGREVEVHRPDGSLRLGRAVDVDPGGRLVVAGEDGSDTVTAGDVRHVRHCPT